MKKIITALKFYLIILVGSLLIIAAFILAFGLACAITSFVSFDAELIIKYLKLIQSMFATIEWVQVARIQVVLFIAGTIASLIMPNAWDWLEVLTSGEE